MTEVHTQPLDKQAVRDLITGGSPEELQQHTQDFGYNSEGHIAGIINTALMLFPLATEPGAFVDTLGKALMTRSYLQNQQDKVIVALQNIVKGHQQTHSTPENRRIAQLLGDVLNQYQSGQTK